MRGWILGLMVAVGVILGTLSLLFAQGAPTAPSAVLDNALTPGTAQTVSITVEFAFNSISAPNAVWDPNFHLTYSVVEAASNGYSNTVVASETTGVAIVGQNGSFYTLSDTAQVTLPGGVLWLRMRRVVENVTVTAAAVVVTPYHAWFSAQTMAVFTSQQSGCTVSAPCLADYGGGPSPSIPPRQTHATQDSFYAELLVPLTALGGAEAIAAYGVAMKHPAIVVAGAGLLVLTFVELVVFGVL